MQGQGFSVARRLAASLALTLFLLFTLIGVGVYLDSRERAFDRAAKDLAVFNQDIVNYYEAKFARISATQASASAIFRTRLETVGTDGALESRFDEMFPRRPDGTRRSADDLYEGGEGNLFGISGVGAFLSEASRISPAQAIAAAETVFLTGRVSAFDLSSVYFFTPDDALIIYAPQRSDRLEYYRKTASASMSFAREEFSRLSSPAENPSRAMRCTSLRPIMHANASSVWTTACVTPFDLDGRHVGSFGTSLLLDDVLDAPFFNGPNDGSVILISPEGRLLTPPRLSAGDSILGRAIRSASSTAGDYPDISSTGTGALHDLWSLLGDHGARGYSGYSDELGAFVAIERIPTTGWYTVATRSGKAVTAEALHPVKRVAIAAILCSVLMVAVCLVVTRRTVIGPLRELAGKVRMLAGTALADQSDLPRRGRNEFAYVSDLVDRMAGEVARVRSELEQRVARRTFELEAANHKLRLLSERDMLTDLPNRRKIMDDFAAMWGAYDRMAVILLDVDHFKSINDRHGHPGGDAVLKQVAGRLAGALRHGSLLGRVGGEEFMVVAPVSGHEEADALASRLRAVIAADPVTVTAGESLPVTISVGVALRSSDDTQDGIYARADANLYQAKKAGRDIVCREGRIFKTAGAVQAQRMRIVKS